MSSPTNYIGQEQSIEPSMSAKLRTEAQSNKAFEALMQIMSVRERSRRQITLRTLQASFNNEGYDFKKADIARCLRFLAALGVGELVETANQQVEQLRDIRYSLHSISEAALSGRIPPHKLMSVDDIPASKFVGASKSNATMATFVATPEASRVPAPPFVGRATGQLGSPAAVADLRTAQVVITVGKNEMKFEIPISQANELIKQLL